MWRHGIRSVVFNTRPTFRYLGFSERSFAVLYSLFSLPQAEWRSVTQTTWLARVRRPSRRKSPPPLNITPPFSFPSLSHPPPFSPRTPPLPQFAPSPHSKPSTSWDNATRRAAGVAQPTEGLKSKVVVPLAHWPDYPLTMTPIPPVPSHTSPSRSIYATPASLT